MKIERINDNQIRCTLTSEDLRKRNIKLSELAYGSDNAKKLFRDMLRVAFEKYGFDGENRPIVVEAIPTSASSLIIVFTKVDNPEEVDVRFSRFTPSPEDSFAGDEEGDGDFESDELYEDEIELDMGLDDEPSEMVPLDEIPFGGDTPSKDNASGLFKEIAGLLERENEKKKRRETHGKDKKEVYRTFVFNDLNKTAEFSKLIAPGFKGKSDLYKDNANHRYFLVLYLDELSSGEYAQICGIGYEYATVLTGDSLMFYKEYYKGIAQGDALEKLKDVL